MDTRPSSPVEPGPSVSSAANSSADAVSLAVVIPTRNRASLAIAACDSLLQQMGCRYQVFVSDNSTKVEERQRLSDYCAAANSPRLTYLKPNEPLAMSAHWDWALRTAMDRSDATHLTVHYDRRITKPGKLAPICRAAGLFPEDVVTFFFDLIISGRGRSVVTQPQWDGRLYIVPTSRVVEMTVKGRITEMGQAFPVLSNCAVPRAVFDRIRARFGTICDSTAPDSSFTYRFCATHDRYVHYDRSVGIAYGFDRSTGLGFVRGSGGDFGDFMQWWGDRPWLDAAPIPGLNMGQNVLFHEYELVRRVTHDPRFKPVEMRGYLRDLGHSLHLIIDRARYVEVKAILVSHGWHPSHALDGVPQRHRATRVREGLPWIRTLLQDLWETTLLGFPPDVDDNSTGVHRLARVAWWKLKVAIKSARARTKLLLADHLNIPPRDLSAFEFATDQEAIRRVIDWPRERTDINDRLDWFGPVEVTSLADHDAVQVASGSETR